MSRQLKDQRATLISQARSLIDVAEKDNRDLTAEEQEDYNGLIEQIDALKARIDRSDRLAALDAELETSAPRRNSAQPGAFNINRNGLGDNEVKATAAYIKRGDRGAIAGLGTLQTSEFMAASNDTDMNVTTAADGGVLVPTAHWNGIVAKRNEAALFGPLGVTPYNGARGTTMDVPIETGSANVFVSTAESPGTFDRDAPVLDKVQLTLVNFTKDIELTNDLLDMEDNGLMTFLTNYVGRALGLTHNSALITEVLADGTSVALGATAAATAGDIETMEGALAAEYSDNAYFVMRRATLYKYRALTGNLFLYQSTPAGGRAIEGGPQPRPLGESLVFQSSYLAAMGAGNKSLAYGDFAYVGMRETPLVFLYDPYSKASTGRKMLHYYTRIVYKVTNADAVLYGKHPTA